MADPISIIGLVSGIITFIDFGLKVVSENKKLRDSASRGTSDAIDELDLYIQNVHDWNLKVIKQQSNGLDLSADEKRILGMVQKCERLVKDLRDVIEPLKLQNGVRSKTLETARVAIQRRWKSSDIQDIRERLQTLDGQIRRNVECTMNS